MIKFYPVIMTPIPILVNTTIANPLIIEYRPPINVTAAVPLHYPTLFKVTT